MATAAELFDLAWKHHQAGDLAEAERLYREIIQADASHADAWCFLGAVCQAQGQKAEAEANYRQAIQLAPAFASALNSLGILLAEQGKLEEAAYNFLQVLQHHPTDTDAHNNLGLVRARQGDWELAIACYRRALRVQSDYAGALNNLNIALQHGPPGGSLGQEVYTANQRGVNLAHQGRLEEAKSFFYLALEIQQDDAVALNNLSSALILQDRQEEALTSCLEAIRLMPTYAAAHHNLGSIRDHKHKFDEAVQSFHEALRLLPAYPEAYYSLANTLKRQNKLDEALTCYQQAIRLKPDFVDACNNCAALLCALGRFAEAEVQYQNALRQKPDYTEARTNLGVLHRDQGRFEEALAQFDQALALQPDFAEVHYNRALVWLLLGDLERGWPEFAWRWRQKNYYNRRFPQPLWDGTPLDGRTILLHAEQGFGDTFQMIRYAAVAKARGGRVIAECQSGLQHLVKTAPGIEQLLTYGSTLPPFDVHSPLLDLPGICHTTLDTIPGTVPYLQADPELMEKWRECRVGGVFGTHQFTKVGSEDSTHPTTRHSQFLIGIAWQGNPNYGLDRIRSIPLNQFAPLAKIEGVRFVSLQKRWGIEQIANVKQQFEVLDLSDRLDETSGAFMDTAAIMKNLDLVICSDSAVAHLAGALGVPVWLALPFVPDWRWLLERDDSPWYPTMRLFRQKRYGEWEDVFEKIAEALKTRLASG
ncbi:MAG TPA: tetratricopeptide repeat protein [Gemmataceae bacterium]|nr:tetratricopeptide repeat protein [Gemmataceae bacterium]